MRITLKAARVNSGLTIEEASKKLGVTAPTLSSWESGLTYPRVDMLNKFEEIYDVKYDNIVFFKKTSR